MTPVAQAILHACATAPTTAFVKSADTNRQLATSNMLRNWQVVEVISTRDRLLTARYGTDFLVTELNLGKNWQMVSKSNCNRCFTMLVQKLSYTPEPLHRQRLLLYQQILTGNLQLLKCLEISR